MVEHLVLAGGGHTHALVLRDWVMQPRMKPLGLITLINRESTIIYSAMLPGHIARKYSLNQIKIDLRKLAQNARVAFVQGEIEGLDLLNKRLFIKNRLPIDYTTLSLDVGSETDDGKDQFKKDSKVHFSIRPFEKALNCISNEDVNSSSIIPFAVIGAGLAGLEIVLALRKRWPQSPLELHAYPGKISLTAPTAGS